MFKVGDRVQMTEDYQDEEGERLPGTIVATDDTPYPILVKLDVDIPGVEYGRFFPNELELI